MTAANATGDAVGGEGVRGDDKRDAADGQPDGTPPQGGTETATGDSAT